MTAWPILQAVAAMLSVIVSIAALLTSRAAISATRNVSEIDKTIKSALLEFRQDLAREKLLINQEVIDYRFKGEDDKIHQLDQRITRTSDQVALMLKVMLEAGFAGKLAHAQGEGG